jgi:hypothetical protein
VIAALPAQTAVTSPCCVTVATAVLALDHEGERPLSALPAASLMMADA